MSEQVRRYDYGYVDDGNGSRYLGLIERDTGKLVRHDDYDTLHAEAEALRAENGRLREALELSANRLDRLTLEVPGGYWREQAAEWASEARAASSGQEVSRDNQ
ncbi:hypothetical protein ACPA2N_25685 [Ectopseudomonas hydrolytica]|uniref:hypothetical protein n=1 Tax=Ectopseudomonas hydrolytica TaxID=2493633 RepID=UPI003C2DB204